MWPANTGDSRLLKKDFEWVEERISGARETLHLLEKIASRAFYEVD